MNTGTLYESYRRAQELGGKEKLSALKNIYDSIHSFETSALKDMSISINEIRRARALLDDVVPAINRLEAAQKKREVVHG